MTTTMKAMTIVATTLCLLASAPAFAQNPPPVAVSGATWNALLNHDVIVEIEGGKLLGGKLVSAQPGSLQLQGPDGHWITVEAWSIRSVRERADGEPLPSNEPTDEKADAIRIRGGISSVAGFAFVSSNAGSAVAPTIGFSGRFGVQFTHVFSLYYQNMGVVPVEGGAAGFFDYNSFLVNFTAGHTVDIGAGPSADILVVRSVTATLFGVHGRIAANIGGSKGHGPRRRGLSLGLDLHPTFGPGGLIFTTGLGVGYEWF